MAEGVNTKKLIFIALLVSCVVAGVSIASAGAKPYPDLPGSPAYTSRYPVIDDVIGSQHQIETLQAEVKHLRGQVGVLQLLRAHDIEQADERRASDLKSWADARRQDQLRLSSLEWNVNTLWEMCR